MRPQAVILDEGELDDVREILEDLGVTFGASLPVGEDAGEPVALVVTTPERAGAVYEAQDGSPSAGHHLHVVVTDAEGGGLGSTPCDFVVRRPFEPALLRLLAERASYGGPERRRATRVAIGAPVTLRVDGEKREAILAQLSIGGCGLISATNLDPDETLEIALPEDLTAPRKLILSGRILSAREFATADGVTFDVSVVFDALDLVDRVTLRALMAGQPIDFRPQPSPEADADPPAAPGTRRRRGVPPEGNRRGDSRRRYRRRLLGGREGVARVIVGRDLSEGGMRIERDPDLALGDELKLALHGSAGAAPVMVLAVVDRDDGEDGWFLRFATMPGPVAQSLARLLALLAPLDLHGRLAGPGAVVSEVLD